MIQRVVQCNGEANMPLYANARPWRQQVFPELPDRLGAGVSVPARVKPSRTRPAGMPALSVVTAAARFSGLISGHELAPCWHRRKRIRGSGRGDWSNETGCGPWACERLQGIVSVKIADV